MITLLGPTPCIGCGTPVRVDRTVIHTTPHRHGCRCAPGSPGCSVGLTDAYRAIVTVETDGRLHHCSQERRPPMSRGATGAMPTRRYVDGAHRVPVPGDATPPAPSAVAIP